MSHCETTERESWIWCVNHDKLADRRTDYGTPVCQTYYDNLENSVKQAASLRPMTVPLVSIVDGVRYVIGTADVDEIGIGEDGVLLVKGAAYLDPGIDIEIVAKIHPLSKLLFDSLAWSDVRAEDS